MLIKDSLKPLSDDDPALARAKLSSSALKILHYIDTHGHIGLTQSKAFNRKFVEWAAEAFNWPGYTPDELYRINKVLNELDLPPLELLHWLLRELKLIRHYKLTCKLTKLGTTFLGRPGALFNHIVPVFLFQVDHGNHYYPDREPAGPIGAFIPIIQDFSEANQTISATQLRGSLFGPPPSQMLYDELAASIAFEILKPLEWAGLLQEQAARARSLDTAYTMTPLSKRTLGSGNERTSNWSETNLR